MDCWICKARKADSGEHIIKKSELKATYSDSPKHLYRHSSTEKSKKIQSIGSDALKFSKVICSYCNNTLTQPYDLAFDTFMRFFRENRIERLQGRFRAKRIFPYDTSQEMKDVYLYFAKIFGCILASNSVPIPLQSFSETLIKRKFHPDFFIGLGTRPSFAKGLHITDLDTFSRDSDIFFANMVIIYEHISIYLVYETDIKRTSEELYLWHRKKSSNLLKIIDSNIFFKK